MVTSSAKVVRLVWAICLLIGTGFHMVDFFRSGGAYPGYPLGTVVFWNALTVLDPLAATLLFWRPRLGVLSTLAIILSDVSHNVWAVATYDAMVWPVAMQAAFLVFVLATAHLIWRDSWAQEA
jgi:hypothetical protein